MSAQRMPTWTVWMLAGAIAGATACGEQPTITEPVARADSMRVSLRISPDTIPPGGSAIIAAEAVPRETRWVSEFELRMSGLIDTVLALPVVSFGSQRISLTLVTPRAPVLGTIHMVLHARSGAAADSASGDLVLWDDQPPTIEPERGDSLAEPGGTVPLKVVAFDNAGLTQVSLSVTGGFQFDSVTPLPYAQRWTAEFNVAVSSSAPMGDTAHVRWEALDMFGYETVVEYPIVITDRTPPRVSAEVSSIVGGPFYRGYVLPAYGDTIFIAAEFSDNHRLAWYGYELSSVPSARDSFPVADDHKFITIPLVMSPEWPVGSVFTTVFARDSLGNLGFVWVHLPVFHGIRRPLRYIEDTETAFGDEDFVHDTNRDRLYLINPYVAQILVLNLATLTYDEPIPLPYVAHSMDITPSGDSLVIALEQTPYIGIVDLTAPALIVDTLRLENADDHTSIGVRVTADNRAIVTVGAIPIDEVAHVVDFGTGEQRLIRMDPNTDLWRSGDRSTFLATGHGSSRALLYDPVLDSMVDSANVSTGDPPSIDSNGLHFAMGAYRDWTVYDRGFRPVVTINAPFGVMSDPLLSHDGAVVFMGDSIEMGYHTIDVETGEITERVLLPWAPTRFYLFPDGEQLLVFSARPIVIVDLR